MGNADNTRVDDQYLIEVLKLTPTFIIRHAKAMGNISKPRAYFLDTVLSYLRGLEAEMQRKSQRKVVDRATLKETFLRTLEEARIAVAARKRKTA